MAGAITACRSNVSSAELTDTVKSFVPVSARRLLAPLSWFVLCGFSSRVLWAALSELISDSGEAECSSAHVEPFPLRLASFFISGGGSVHILPAQGRRGQGKLFQRGRRLMLDKKGERKERKVRCLHRLQERRFKDKSFRPELLKPATLSSLQETIRG